MSINSEDIEKLGELARIGIAPDSIAATAERINAVLLLVEQLQAADTEEVEPLANPLEANQRLRDDVIAEHNCRAEYQSQAPAAEQGLYLVPKVIE